MSFEAQPGSDSVRPRSVRDDSSDTLNIVVDGAPIPLYMARIGDPTEGILYIVGYSAKEHAYYWYQQHGMELAGPVPWEHFCKDLSWGRMVREATGDAADLDYASITAKDVQNAFDVLRTEWQQSVPSAEVEL